MRHYRDLLSRSSFGTCSYIYDEKSRALLDELFSLLEQVVPNGEDGSWSLWFRAERGPIGDGGGAGALDAEGEYESREQLVRAWEQEFPEPVRWYAFSAVEAKEAGYRAVLLEHRLVMVQDRYRAPRPFPADTSPFVQWLVDSARECVGLLRAGTYNGYVRDHLPPQHRAGTIRRRDIWDIWPEEKAAFFGGLSPADAAAFIRLASAQPADRKDFTPRLASMTAGGFFRFCSLGYAANGCRTKGLSPREQYRRFADGRDEGLSELDEDSPEAFHAWLTGKHGGGHPWAVSAHISLGVACDDGGYWLRLKENAASRTVETVRFYLALCRAGAPVYLGEGDVLAERVAGTEPVGIVPEGVTPADGRRYFPGQHIVSFMALPEEDREKFLPRCVWQPVGEVSLRRPRAGAGDGISGAV